ncbi:VOC family protein [Mycobacterium sp. GA-2829]|uniref:VOC family protein n=1 Tax=Mycobacterium sp. GA-2829 TaxID=1772283 RepID=UPI000AFDFE60
MALHEVASSVIQPEIHNAGVELQRAVPILSVADVEAAVQEYSALLGLDVPMNHGWIATLGSPGGAQFSVMSRDRTAPCNPDMSVEVSDVDVAFARAREGGVEIVHPLQDEDWGVRRFFFRTADGQVVNVLSHRHR